MCVYCVEAVADYLSVLRAMHMTSSQ